MKKIIIFMILSLIIGSMSVFADGFTIHKGWNLVSNQILEEIPNEPSLDTIFLFNPLNKNYVSFSENGRDKVDSLLSSMDNLYGSEDLYVYSTPFWYYSDKEIGLDLNLDSSFSYPSYFGELSSYGKLFSGWNLITVTSPLTSENFDWGDCEVSRIFFWGSENQKWFEYESTPNKMPTEKIREDIIREPNFFLGKGLTVKVIEDCSLNFERTSDIPQVPSLPN